MVGTDSVVVVVRIGKMSKLELLGKIMTHMLYF